MHRDLWLSGHMVELPEMLAGRERRAARQAELLQSAAECCTLISYTVNMPGPVKVCATSEIVFDAGLDAIDTCENRAGWQVRERRVYEETYGHEYFLVVQAEPVAVKRELTAIEESHPLGRLFDIDVIRPGGSKVSRADIGLSARRCLICGSNASDCAGRRVHSVPELQDKILQTVMSYEREPETDRSATVVAAAYSAMMAEVQTTPKPGLVDLRNNGSHKDMTIETFERSAMAIREYFGGCYIAGSCYQGELNGFLPELRKPGLVAESVMFAVTDGVNTHKGLIFSLGIICGALGYIDGSCRETGNKDNKDNEYAVSLRHLLDTASEIAAPAAHELTASGRNDAGARAQAAAGFPQLTDTALQAWTGAERMGLDTNACGVYTLLSLISATDDTNMVKRGGSRKADEMKIRAGNIVQEWEKEAREETDAGAAGKGIQNRLLDAASKLDEAFIADNLSPGGCADILALLYFVLMLGDLSLIKC